jgi:methyl-accepting chemotaxis protein
VSFTTIPQWQWLVGGIALDDELLAGMRTLRNRFLMIAAVLVAAFAGLFVLVVRRVVSRPLDAAARASERYAAGDSVRIRDGATARGVAGNDEIGRLVQAVDGIGDGLARIVAQVRGSARHRERDGRHRGRQQRHRRADRDAGEQRRANGREHGADHDRRAAERRARGAGRCAGGARRRRRPPTATRPCSAWSRRWTTSAARRAGSPKSRPRSKASRSRPTSSR